jgi:hypothetical protein
MGLNYHPGEEKSAFDRFLDYQIEERIRSDVRTYATRKDGTVDEGLKRRIEWEVGRRGETGKQLDIYEPLRWTGIRAVLGVLGAASAKMISDRVTGKKKQLFFTIEIATIVTTAISSAIDLLRLYPRWLAGLKGGRNTAIKLHNEFAAPPNDQAFAPIPPEHMPKHGFAERIRRDQDKAQTVTRI